jgi:hypothetical protein
MRGAPIAVLAASAFAAPAAAATWHSYSAFNGNAPVEGGSGRHSARLTSIVLPDAFHVRKHPTRLTFGPTGACRATGVIAPVLVHSDATTAADVLREQVSGGTTYGSGTRGDAVYRIAKFPGGSLRAAYVRRTSLAQTWIVVRATTTPHATCHIGGVRESLGFPLTDAYGTIRASGF